ncbi:conserved hypothetical protein [Coccidioides posadasii str. Silveira]|uniref:F-box domain-containing protein n=1 Tax=Coccidioides posadasii (strain RMSCC 757 / Silveira) TaxID=443226 RepID=E9DCV7_COCPS|nr:conserved hypothetical protein [Coccidioides posadasii str. Silveira]
MMFWEAIPLLALGGPLFIAGLLCGSFVQIEDRGLLRNSTSIHSSQGHERDRSISCFVLYPSILATCFIITTVLVRLIPVVSAKAQDQSLHAAVSGQQDPLSPLDARRKNSWGPYSVLATLLFCRLPRRLLFFCTRFLRQPRQNRTAPIWRLPPELILMIADNLCPSDTAAFCLASKRILGVIGERAFELSGNELYKFLSRLQSGMPNHILCYQCAKFHHKFLVEQSWHLECERRNRCMETAFGQFPFTDAQQVMNYHFYGTRHWLFPGITVYYEDDSPDDNFRGWELVDLRISGEDLLLRQQIAVSFHHSQTRPPEAGTALNYPFRLCAHLDCWQVFKFPRCERVFLKCPVCKTEISTCRNPLDKEHEWIDITIWRVLGSCRNPTERQWRLLTRRCRRARKPLFITRGSAVIWQRFANSPRLPVKCKS